MNAQKQIVRLLEQWFQLSQAEGAAINAGSWPKVTQIQAGKIELQKSLAEAEKQWAAENPNAPAGKCREMFRVEFGRLISLEERNAALLAEQQRRAHERRATIELANRNLRKIQGSYDCQHSPALWNSYS